MNQTQQWFSIEVESTNGKCPIGETTGNRNIGEADRVLAELKERAARSRAAS